MSTLTEWILKKQLRIAEGSVWVFPSNSASGHIEEPKSQIAAITKATGIKFTPHDLRRTFATHAEANGAEFELIRKALNHKSGGTITSKYIIRQVQTLRPVFEAVSDAYHTAYEPDWKADLLAEKAEQDHYTKEWAEGPEAEALFYSDES
jgi:integrase